MAYFRKKICAYPNCPNYAEKDSSYCELHKKAEPSRDTTSKYESFYKTTWWTKARKQFLIHHTWCEECLKEHRYTLANTVHHTQGFCDWQSFCDVSKWEAICASCHSKIHAKETNEDLYKKYNGG